MAVRIINNCEGCKAEHGGNLPPEYICDHCGDVSENKSNRGLRQRMGKVLNFLSASVREASTDPAQLIDLRKIK